MHYSSAFRVYLLLLLRHSTARISSSTSTLVGYLDSQSQQSHLLHPKPQEPRKLAEDQDKKIQKEEQKQARQARREARKQQREEEKKQQLKKEKLENENKGENKGENGESSDLYFEGDIVPTADQLLNEYENGEELLSEVQGSEIIAEKGDTEGTRELLALTNRYDRLWPYRNDDDVVEVPYEFEAGKFNKAERETITEALDELYEINHVIKFVPRTNQKNYILIVRESGCGWSHVGRIYSGQQKLMINCVNRGTTQHEFMHSIGLWHEQSRKDRDDYITILEDNIIDGKHHNFNIRTDSDSLRSLYDYDSVMHYTEYAFSKNRKKTIDARGHSIGQRSGASPDDVLNIQQLYQCTDGQGNPAPRTLTQFTNDPCNRNCKCWEGKTGCGNDNDSCQGNLVCSANTCVAPGTVIDPTPAPVQMPSPKPPNTTGSVTPFDWCSQCLNALKRFDGSKTDCKKDFKAREKANNNECEPGSTQQSCKKAQNKSINKLCNKVTKCEKNNGKPCLNECRKRSFC